ncbi:Alpha-2B adrenergic receptor [Trichoplax sp. H2]|nr:Alpha-2B adrenergic receptor [Trichoplax sp. H2]|eukprot:RDD38816.1 Alpha-2B adrenergic receptor [Trichoplax sp. H2]
MSNSTVVLRNITNTSIAIYPTILRDFGLVVGFLTLINNGILFLIMVSSKSLKTNSNMIISSLFIIGVFYSSIYVIPSFALSHFLLGKFCAISNAIGISLVLNYNLHQCLISVDRFLAVRWPHHYKTLKAKHYAVIILLVWLDALASQTIPLLTFRRSQLQDCRIHLASLQAELLYVFWVFIFWYLVPLLIMITCYFYIIYFIYKRRIQINPRSRIFVYQKSITAKDNAFQATIQMALLAGIFFVSMAPFICIITLSTAILTRPEVEVYIKVSYIITLCFPAINPILYAYFVTGIRQVVNMKVKSIRKFLIRN